MGGGAWPFLVGGVICLVNSVNERDPRLLNSWANCSALVSLDLSFYFIFLFLSFLTFGKESGGGKERVERGVNGVV